MLHMQMEAVLNAMNAKLELEAALACCVSCGDRWAFLVRTSN